MRFAFFMLLLFVLHWVSAQEPYALQLDKKAGLPSQSVYDLMQDKNGFIWLASDVGLTRYDGFRFETFHCADQTSFPGSCLKEDAFGRVWYENFDGFLYYYDNESGKLRALDNTNSLGYLPFGITKKHLFYISKDGIVVHDLADLKKVKVFKVELYNPQHTSTTKNKFYFLDDKSLYTVDEKLNLSLTKLSGETKMPGLVFSLNDTLSVVIAKFHPVKIGFILDRKERVVSRIDLSEVPQVHNINSIDNLIWVSSPSGNYVYDLQGNKKAHYFSNLSVSCVLKDRQHNYWFSSTNQGVFIVPKLENKFLFGNDMLPSKIVAYKQNTNLLSTKRGQIFQVDNSMKPLKTLVDNRDLGDIFFLNYDSVSDVISYTANRFLTLQPKSSKFDVSFSSSVKDLAVIDEKYTAFAASNISGFIVHRKDLKSEWDGFLDKLDSLNVVGLFVNMRARSVVYDDKKKLIYFATNVGLFEVSPVSIREIQNNGKSVFASRLTIFDNKLHVLSTKGNLHVLDENQNFQKINSKFGLADYDIRFIKNFGNELIVASTSYIFRYDWFTKNIDQYDLNVSEFDINDIHIDGDNLFLLFNQGIIKTSLAVHKAETSEPRFIINKISSKDLEFRFDEKIELDYDYNDVKIEYSILDFGKLIPATLYYRVNNGAWNKTSVLSRELNFPKLESGSYFIDFKFGDSKVIASFSFTLLKPWWKTWWFIFTILSASTLLAYAYYQNRVKILSDKNKLLEENIELEKNLRKSVLTTIKSQMNPHFLYNALNTIQAYIYSNDKENAGKYLVKFSKLTRQVLEMSELEFVGLDQELDTIQLYLDLEKARFDDDFTVELNVHEIEHYDDVKVPPMLIQPYIENAIKHGLLHKSGQKILKIDFIEQDGVLLVRIDDNGIGRKRSGELNSIKAKNHKSFASDANAKRLEVLNHARNHKFSVNYIDKLDQGGNSLGTCVELKIPLMN